MIMKTVLTIHDFSQVFDAYAEFSQSILDAMMASLADEEDAAETNRELAHMKAFEELADCRPLVVENEVTGPMQNDFYLQSHAAIQGIRAYAKQFLLRK